MDLPSVVVGCTRGFEVKSCSYLMQEFSLLALLTFMFAFDRNDMYYMFPFSGCISVCIYLLFSIAKKVCYIVGNVHTDFARKENFVQGAS